MSSEFRDFGTFSTSPAFAGLAPQNSSVLDAAWDVVKDQLKDLALAPNGYDRLDLVFDIADPSTAQMMLSDWGNGIFPNLPNVVILPDGDLNGNAGAYSADREEIYLSASLIQTDPLTGALPRVLAEEFGHHVDDLLNPGNDTAGDEGELLSEVLFGHELTSEKLAQLRSEDDHGVIVLGNDLLSVEYSQIAIESLNGTLYQSMHAEDNKIYTRSSRDGQNWTAWHEAGGETRDALALAAFNGKLYQSHRGLDNRIYTRSSTNGETWLSWDEDGGRTYDAVALAAFDDKLYQSHRGMDNKIYTRSTSDGRNWSSWEEDGGTTYDAPSLAAFDDKLYQSHRGTDDRIYTRYTSDGRNWSSWEESGGITKDAIALEAAGDRLYQAHTGTDNRIYTRYMSKGRDWSRWYEAGGTTYDAPSLASIGSRLYQSHNGTDNNVYTRSSYSGRYWSGWHQLGSWYQQDVEGPLTFERIQGPGFFEDKETWLIIHGWRGAAENYQDLAVAIEEYSDRYWGESDQVITVDWSAARTGANLPGAAGKIDLVAEAIKNTIQSWGIFGSKINLVGHSLGAYVAYEVSERLGRIDRLVALNPAARTLNGYDRDQVDFSRYSNWSWAFWHNPTFDSEDQAVTADESFQITFTERNWDSNKGHGSGRPLWTNMLNDQSIAMSTWFGLQEIRPRSGTPWGIDNGDNWEARIEVDSNYQPTNRYWNQPTNTDWP